MKHFYEDILKLTKKKPSWFDEHGVPRFCRFHPNKVNDIYASEVVLMRIECQSCRHRFRVALSWYRLSGERSLTEWGPNNLCYGDPPNIWCCSSGPSMNSVPKRILQFWRKDKTTEYKWERAPELEVAIDCGWD